MPRPPRRIVWAALALFVLLGMTFGLAFVPLGSMNVVVALTIAGAKGLIVAFVFMELARGPAMKWIFAGTGFFWVMFLFGLTMIDYLTRNGLAERVLRHDARIKRPLRARVRILRDTPRSRIDRASPVEGRSNLFGGLGDDPEATLIAIVGGPDPGKVDWHPSVIEAARKTGLSVDDEGKLIVAEAAE